MEFFRETTHFKIVGLRKITLSVAVFFSLAAIILLIVKGLNFGLEFTGGTQVELRFPEAVAIESVQNTLGQAELNSRVQHFGSTEEVLARIVNVSNVSETILRGKIADAFAAQDQTVEIRRIEFIGAEVGEQLAKQGIMAVIVAIIATMIYIAVRFEYKFAISAALTLLHDALIVLGVFVLFQVEFDLAALASVLAVVGYSLNDKIVVFDRVREDFRMQRGGNAIDVMDTALNQTLSRTIMTSIMTLLVVLALLIFGGESLFSFSLALSVGIVVGTYSSIFVASGAAIALGLNRQDLLPKPKVVVDNLP